MDTAGLYRICPNGTPKLAIFLLTPRSFMHVCTLSEKAADEEAVVIAMANVDAVFFQSSCGAILRRAHAARV